MTEYEKELKKFITIKLRKVSMQWPARNNVKKKAKVERGLYKCTSCKQLFGPTQIQMDHIKPVISIKIEYKTFDEWLAMFVRGLFTPEENWQALCLACHASKTLLEQNISRINKKRKKEKKNG